MEGPAIFSSIEVIEGRTKLTESAGIKSYGFVKLAVPFMGKKAKSERGDQAFQLLASG
jgi:hypothetical protein